MKTIIRLPGRFADSRVAAMQFYVWADSLAAPVDAPSR